MPGKSKATLCTNLGPQTKVEDEEAGISAMKQQVCKLWLAGIINTEIVCLSTSRRLTFTSFMRTRWMQAYPLQILLYGECSLRIPLSFPVRLHHDFRCPRNSP